MYLCCPLRSECAEGAVTAPQIKKMIDGAAGLEPATSLPIQSKSRFVYVVRRVLYPLSYATVLRLTGHLLTKSALTGDFPLHLLNLAEFWFEFGQPCN